MYSRCQCIALKLKCKGFISEQETASSATKASKNPTTFDPDVLTQEIVEEIRVIIISLQLALLTLIAQQPYDRTEASRSSQKFAMSMQG